jgi:DEAD/DEAH box helicase domain-containing protein
VNVSVTHQVTGYLRTLLTGEVLDLVPLDLPEQRLQTHAAMYTVTPQLLSRAGIARAETGGALHAAEHTAIGLLPLIASCDRWDAGGLSTVAHADTGLPTVFVYDGHPGGAGFAERGYRQFAAWLTAARDTISSCECVAGCPSCIQSPKCGNGNQPLYKDAAIRLLGAVLDQIR